jgi:hypothetical protein
VQESKTGSAKLNPKSRKAGRIQKTESAISRSVSAFGLLSAFGFRDSPGTPVWLAKKIGFIIFFYLETRLI